MHQSFPCAPSPRLLRWHVRGEPPRLSTSLIIWGTSPFFNTFPHPFPHSTPPLHPPYIAKHPKHMFENTICCVYSNGGMPPVAPRRSTSTFKLTLRRFLRPLTCRSHRPQTPPPKARAAHHRDAKWRKMGRAPDCPCARKSTPRQSGARPQIPINMQVSDVLTMCQRVRRQIDLGQLRTIDMRVDLRGRYIGMSQDLL